MHEIAQAAAIHGRLLAPHSPYFGPGLLATLQLAGAHPHIGEIEGFGVKRGKHAVWFCRPRWGKTVSLKYLKRPAWVPTRT